MTDFDSRSLAGVPLLLARRPDAHGPLPAVLWFHGFGVDKETHRKELAQLADAGFLAVGVDAAGHGARRLPDLVERQAAPRDEALRTMIALVAQTAAEVPAIVRALADEELADVDRVGIAGISMGGYVVYQATAVCPGLRAAVALLGSPEWPEGGGPDGALDALGRVALLSVTGECDENVPPRAARTLHARLAEAHPRATQRYVEIPGAVHLMAEAHWHQAMDETLRWLRLHLG
ncbi:alpha/beta hydrolase family protein [Longimicrobium sp.]|uniref:alpha/beta hydrolase family protein n=1 Tax=Longimicrobium sp. TaxID=2029185 RepID=UPI002E3221C7|nr:alpha/beta fold hydrolase [Longimicrobium sp.]HEX6036649.1 alpha/beta fold hydrolase [Longimicrobium sp.]